MPGLRAALTVRAVVLSAPEPGRIVVGAGKRELPYDAGLPVLVSATDARGSPAGRRRRPRPRSTTTISSSPMRRGWTSVTSSTSGSPTPVSAFDRWPDITVVEDGRVEPVWHPQFR